MRRPNVDEYQGYFQTYVDAVDGNDMIAAQEKGSFETMNFLENLPVEKGNFRYAEGKWSIKEIILHLSDSERVFCYRALRFARGDKTDLPGYDHDKYVTESSAENRSLAEIAREFAATRKATIELFKSFDNETLDRRGTANGFEISVRAIGFVIAGHEAHHLKVIKERYL